MWLCWLWFRCVAEPGWSAFKHVTGSCVCTMLSSRTNSSKRHKWAHHNAVSNSSRAYFSSYFGDKYASTLTYAIGDSSWAPHSYDCVCAATSGRSCGRASGSSTGRTASSSSAALWSRLSAAGCTSAVCAEAGGCLLKCPAVWAFAGTSGTGGGSCLLCCSGFRANGSSSCDGRICSLQLTKPI